MATNHGSDKKLSMKKIRIDLYPHHQRQKLCKTRPAYRRGKKETAIKVFTIADESIYLLIQKVPILSGVDVENDLKYICHYYGPVIEFHLVDYPNQDPFTNTYLVKYATIVDAIKAKKHLDDYEFLGSILHVCYAPEQETPEETLNKLNSRQRYLEIKMAQQKNLASSQRE